ncbi:hypothetical protein C2G38_2241418 [Gigaspora rosea]|uniref:Protein kinase domain-containing protein n=1 Tax=Gigaspora rosea TaxID=44941 RepID=A0A397VUE5_9GLOM|nr:hypothetical protein C2G38_2241418 [Gigaspora rosea]
MLKKMIIELIKIEKFARVYRAVFKNKTAVILKSFENNELNINEVINEDVNGGTLRSYLHENSQHIALEEMIKFSLQIINAVRYLHAKGIVNLGLHSENIFIHNKKIKLADYGFSNRLKRQAVKYQYLGFYKKSDVYSVGNLMHEIYNSCLFTENVVGLIDEYIKIYKDCLQNEPNSRPEIQIIVANLKSLIVSCNQNLNRHELEFSNLLIIQDSMMYNSMPLQESLMHIDKTFNLGQNCTLKSPNKILEIETNNANFLNNCGISLDLHNSIETSAQNDEFFSSYQDNTNVHINSFEITTLSPLYLPYTINPTISTQDYDNLENMRKEAHECFNQGKFLKALELYEEIIKNHQHTAEDYKSASTWDLSFNKCGLKNLNELIKALCKDTMLTSLNLDMNYLGSEGGKALAGALCKNSTLTSLDIQYNNLGSEGGKALANALCKNTTLTYLNLWNNKLGPEGGKALADALCKNATLIDLNLGSNILGSEEGKALADALCKNATLTSLHLGCNNLGSEGGKALADAFCKNATLTSLNLFNNKLGPEGGKALADRFCKNITLIDLNLGFNNLGPEGGKALADALCKNVSLTSLNLSRNKLRPEGGKALADAICKNVTLTSLNLALNSLGSEGGKALADAICKNATLTSLDLGGIRFAFNNNNIGPEGGKALANALCKNATLTSLNLDYNNLGSEGGKVLADAIFKNATLISLNLAGNSIGSKGGKALADAICKNATLTSLDLGGSQFAFNNNYIGPEGGKALADALCKNTMLTSLNLSYNNNLGSEGGKALLNALYKNTMLTSLGFLGNNIGSEEEKALDHALRKNNNLKNFSIYKQRS